MALGNANTTAQARGKNKSVIVKRRKEVVAAKSFNSFQISSILTGVENGAGACSSASAVNTTVYHNGEAAKPARNNKVYTKARLNRRYILEDGWYKASISGVNHSLNIAEGVVSACRICS